MAEFVSKVLTYMELQKRQMRKKYLYKEKKNGTKTSYARGKQNEDIVEKAS